MIAKFYSDDTVQTTLGTTINDTFGNLTLENNENVEKHPTLPDNIKIGIIISLTFLVGIVQVSYQK